MPSSVERAQLPMISALLIGSSGGDCRLLPFIGITIVTDFISPVGAEMFQVPDSKKSLLNLFLADTSSNTSP